MTANKFPVELPEERPPKARRKPKKTALVAKDIKRLERVGQEISMINSGHSIEMIADALGISRVTIRKDVMQVLEDLEDFRHAIGEKYVTVHLEMLYQGAQIALKKWKNEGGEWQEGRNYFDALDKIARILDLYPKDGAGTGGVQTVLKVQFNQWNNLPPREGAGAPTADESPIQRMMALMASNEDESEIEEAEIVISPEDDQE